jgi:hypothetical protein
MGVETLAARVFSQCSVFRQDCRVVGGEFDVHRGVPISWAGPLSAFLFFSIFSMCTPNDVR